MDGIPGAAEVRLMAECIAQDALMNPERAPIANKPDEAVAVVWALLDALVEHEDDRLASAILYVQRLPIEDQVAWARGLLNEGFAVRDANAVARVLRSPSFGLYKEFVSGHLDGLHEVYGGDLLNDEEGRVDVTYILRRFYPQEALARRQYALREVAREREQHFHWLYSALLNHHPVKLPSSRSEREAFARFLGERVVRALVNNFPEEAAAAWYGATLLGEWATVRMAHRINETLAAASGLARYEGMEKALGGIREEVERASRLSTQPFLGAGGQSQV